MLSVKGTEVIVENVKELLKGDPVNWIWACFNEIAQQAMEKKDYFSSLEPWLSSYEHWVYENYPEAYQTIIKRSEYNARVRSLLNQDRWALIILDSLSLREGYLLQQELSRELHGQFDYTYAPLPTETEFFAQRYLGVKAPSFLKSLRGLPYSFEEIEVEDDLRGKNFERDKVLVWSRQPDKQLHGFTEGFRITQLNEAYQEAKRILIPLISRLLDAHDTVYITSDHGYVTDLYSWEGLTDFPSDLRYSPTIPESYMANCIKHRDYWLIVGRFNTIKRGKYGHVRHGGLSLMEVLVPFIKMAK
jgi:hypothetical protein